MILPNQPPAPPRILVVSDDDVPGRAIADGLIGEFGAGLRAIADPGAALGECEAFGPEVLVLALRSIEASERLALVLRAPGLSAVAAPFIVALCDTATVGVAARLARQGLVDEYVQHFPEPWDTGRLAASVRLACRFALAARPGASADGAERPIVMVIEDDDFSRKLIALALESDAVELAFESDGASAVGRIREIRPDLILMDVMLPGRDGVELTHI